MPDSRWKLISIRTLCGEGDPLAPRSTLTRKLFLSTPSARRATAEAGKMVVGANHFYPRPPRGGRHASRRHRQHRANFYPRPPRGGRQWGLDLRYFYCGISIHALREEGDTRAILTPTPGTDFYPRPPRGGRPSKAHHNTITSEFLSTPSARRATDKSLPARSHQHYFYPRPPRGGRPFAHFYFDGMLNFYPRPPRGGRLWRIRPYSTPKEFLSTPSARRATCRDCQRNHTWRFLSTPSARRAT